MSIRFAIHFLAQSRFLWARRTGFTLIMCLAFMLTSGCREEISSEVSHSKDTPVIDAGGVEANTEGGDERSVVEEQDTNGSQTKGNAENRDTTPNTPVEKCTANRGFLTTRGDKFVWSNSGEAVLANFAMLGTNEGINLSQVTQSSLDAFLDEMFDGNGFNGVHVMVLGQWFHIDEMTTSSSDREIDQRTFDKLKMIIKTVYARGGTTHLWMWGDAERRQTSRTLAGGAMGAEEKKVLDAIYEQLNDLPGWSMGYGFDLHEWTDAALLKSWHDYLNAKPGFRHLLGARAQKNAVNQIYDDLDYSSYENHKPDYDLLVRLMKHQPEKPSFSEDRFRVRGRGKDLTPEESLVTLWNSAMAGGVAGIYGYLGSESGTSRSYPNAAQLLTHRRFWRGRFLVGMTRANKLIKDGLALKDGDAHFVYYQRNTNKLTFTFSGRTKKVVAVDTRKPYKEISLGSMPPGIHTFDAPEKSDWALAVGEFPLRACNP